MKQGLPEKWDIKRHVLGILLFIIFILPFHVNVSSINCFLENNFHPPPSISTSTMNLSSFSFNEDFATTDFLNASATNATGWGNGRVSLGMEFQPSIWQNTAGQAQAVYVSDNFAYVADGNKGLAIINISDPLHPSSPIYVNTSDEVTGVCIQDNFAYITGLSFGFAVVNISDPTCTGSPIYLENNTGYGDAWDPTLQGDLVFIVQEVEETVSWGVSIINVTNPTNPHIFTHLETIFTVDLWIEGDNLYLAQIAFADPSHGLLTIIDISDPSNFGSPLSISFPVPSQQSGWMPINFFTEVTGVQVQGGYAYVTGDFGLAIINMTDPTTPGPPTYVTFPVSNLRSIYVTDHYAYLANLDDGIYVIDISNPFQPGVPYLLESGYARAVFVEDDYVFIAENTAGLRILPVPEYASRSIAQSLACFTSSSFVHNVTFTVNQTLLPNTSISFQLSNDERNWYPLAPNETFSFNYNLSHTLYWRAILQTASPAEVSPSIDSLQLDLEVFYDEVITLLQPLNNSVLPARTPLEFAISDYLLVSCWYHWDNQDPVLLSTPFLLNTVNSSGLHVLTVGVQSNWTGTTIRTFSFYILGTAVIDFPPFPSAFAGERFFYSFIITNPEPRPFSLLLFINTAQDEVLQGNNTLISLQPGANKTVKLEIRPRHASLHQLEITLVVEESIYYQEVLSFHVGPQWLAPTYFPLVIFAGLVSLFLLFGSGFLVIYVRPRRLLLKRYQELHSQLTQLIDQFVLLTLDNASRDEMNESNHPLGFLQAHWFSPPLEPKELKHQLQALQAEILTEAPVIQTKLSPLLLQAETLWEEYVTLHDSL